jgi:hypothetical protein
MATENGDIRDQLIRLGFKESPLAMVERLHGKYRELLNEALNRPWKRKRLESKLLDLANRIQKICVERGIGNPLEGEPIQWKRKKGLARQMVNPS